MNGVFKAKGYQTVQYEIPTVVIPGTPAAPAEVPTAAPEPVVVAEPVSEPVPEPVAAPEPAVVEVPVASEVEAPAEVSEAPTEAGLVPENPPTE
jgi:hypothetical protein